MQYLTEKRFRRRAVKITLVFCTLFQVISIAIRYVNEYSIKGNIDFRPGLSTVIGIAGEFMGAMSVFAGYAVISYLVFLYGIRGGGEWTLALIAGYALIRFLVPFIGSVSFGLAASLLLAAALAAVYFIWTKGLRQISAVVFCTMLVPYIGALVLLFTTSVPSTDQLLVFTIYGLLNISTDFLVAVLIARTAGYFRERAINKGNGSADIIIGDRILPHGNPVLRSFLASDIVYTAVASIGIIIETVSCINEYGSPVNGKEWATLILPYVALAVYFVLGYAVMVFTAAKLETAFMTSENETAAEMRIEKGKKI